MGTRNAKGTEASLFNFQSWLIPPPAPSAFLCTPATLFFYWACSKSVLITNWQTQSSESLAQILLYKIKSSTYHRHNLPMGLFTQFTSKKSLMAQFVPVPQLSSHLQISSLIIRPHLERKVTVCRKAAGIEYGSILFSQGKWLFT